MWDKYISTITKIQSTNWKTQLFVIINFSREYVIAIVFPLQIHHVFGKFIIEF